MPSLPLLAFHICAGLVGLLSGALAVSLRKGTHRHALAGTVFVISMLCMSSSGVLLAFVKSQQGNVPGGALTFYLVATAWMTARRRKGVGIFDWGALLGVLAILAVTATWGLQAANSPTGEKYGYPIGPYFFLFFVALLAAGGDIRMLARGGISGAGRLARHLWRMCFALFIASSSVFLARQHLFPVIMRRTGALLLLTALPLLLMIFWLVRVRMAGTLQKQFT